MTVNYQSEDTIVALATPPGRGGIGVVRVSGTLVPDLACHLVGGLPKPRLATYVRVRDAQGDTLDRGLALYFPEPHSFTGEHVLEIHGHGGPVVLDMIIGEILKHGVRLASPGEFSERAFLNDKIDLAQAEAIADLIDSASEQAARGSVASLEGVFSAEISRLTDELIRIRTFLEAAIDFPEEEETGFLEEAGIHEALLALQADLTDLLAETQQGTMLQEGFRVVLAGRPNVGKSSLMNRLVGRESAIVTPHAGTTRDVLQEKLLLNGVPIQLVDTAGLRASGHEIEQEGISRAYQQIDNADQVLMLIDGPIGKGDIFADQPQENAASLRELSNLTLVRNKIDLITDRVQSGTFNNRPVIEISARTGEGIETLKAHLAGLLNLAVAGETRFIARRRHLTALLRTETCIKRGLILFQGEPQSELLAEELRLAQKALGEIVGEFTSDDLLGEIFSSFCIGK